MPRRDVAITGAMPMFPPLQRDALSEVAASVEAIGFARAMGRSLVAFDVDKTVLHQGDPNELGRFRAGLAKTLVHLARLGFNLAAVTGNSLAQLSTRFALGLVQELCTTKELALISKFHFFCNGAALYIHFDVEDSDEFDALLVRAPSLTPGALLEQAVACFFDDERCVRQEFIDVGYAKQCCIPQADADAILLVCREEASTWWQAVSTDGEVSAELEEQFYIATGEGASADAAIKAEANSDPINKEASVFEPPGSDGPIVGTRACTLGGGHQYTTALHVSPILSFRHARRQLLRHDKDPRLAMICRIKARMKATGFVRYIVSPGGRATIDINHHLVNKRSALLWLMRHIGTEGVEEEGEPIGTNCIYFGDEVALHGNDLPVADVPGVHVFAVNELSQRVPFRSNVEIPTEFSEQNGPEATKAVLDALIGFIEELQTPGHADPLRGHYSVIAAWKAQRMAQRMEGKCALLGGRVRALSDSKVRLTYRRLEAASAALTALTRCGEGFDELADTVLELVNSIGMTGARVREHRFDTAMALGHGRSVSDHAEEQAAVRGGVRDLAAVLGTRGGAQVGAQRLRRAAL